MTFLFVLKFCNDHKISLTEFAFLFSKIHFNDYKQYVKINGYNDRLLTDAMLNNLVAKDFIFNVHGKYFLTNKTKALFISKTDAIDELLTKYPIKEVYSRLTIDELSTQYVHKIEYSADEHKKVLLDVTYGVNNDYNFPSIETFIIEKYWLNLRIKRLYDTITKQKEQ
jgi:hypothetical protein